MRHWKKKSLFACSNKQVSTTEITNDSYFKIYFLDVGQGDAALIECDEQYMLIDGGDTTAGDKVYDFLVSKGIQHLNILAISHLHKDHIGGLIKALQYTTKVDLTLCNTDYSNIDTFHKLEKEFTTNGINITIPKSSPIPGESDTYWVGSVKLSISVQSKNTQNLTQLTRLYLLSASSPAAVRAG